jgi:hypothetical protein
VDLRDPGDEYKAMCREIKSLKDKLVIISKENIKLRENNSFLKLQLISLPITPTTLEIQEDE